MVIGRYDPIIAEASRRYGVPESHIRAVMGVESGGRQDAVSSAGAGGLMQIMPATYDELRGKHGLGPDRFDPVNNIMGGTAYMRQMYDQFGNWGDAFAAYNAGPGRVSQVKAGERGLPAETRAYMPKVQAAIGQQGAGVVGYRTSYSGPGATYEAGPEFAAMLDNIRTNGPPMTRRAPGTYADAAGMFPEREQELRGLLADESKNYQDGLGLLGNAGQTPSQPPRTDPAAMPGTTQTDRLGIGSRMNDILQQLLQPQQRGPALSPLQYQLAGAGNAVGQLAGVTNRKVGIGELLGALGGGLTKGAAAGEQAQREDLQGQLGNLASAAKIQDYQRDEASRLRLAQGVAALAQQLRASGREREAMMLEANPSLINEFAKEQFKAPEQYTLTPGARRVDASGKVIAENPALPQQPQRPQTVTTREGVFILNPDGTTGTRIGSAVSATPNQSVFEKEAILESDRRVEGGTSTVAAIDRALELNDQAYSGVTAGARAWLDRNVVPGEHGGTATTEFNNVVMGQALSSLKDIFGGNPTEGERKILMDLQASVDKSPAERKVILEGAKRAAEARIARERSRSEQLRQGTYFGQNGGTGGAAGGGDDQATSGGDSAPPARAVNPTTGETLEWNGSAWVPVS